MLKNLALVWAYWMIILLSEAAKRFNKLGPNVLQFKIYFILVIL